MCTSLFKINRRAYLLPSPGGQICECFDAGAVFAVVDLLSNAVPVELFESEEIGVGGGAVREKWCLSEEMLEFRMCRVRNYYLTI